MDLTEVTPGSLQTIIEPVCSSVPESASIKTWKSGRQDHCWTQVSRAGPGHRVLPRKYAAGTRGEACWTLRKFSTSPVEMDSAGECIGPRAPGNRGVSAHCWLLMTTEGPSSARGHICPRAVPRRPSPHVLGNLSPLCPCLPENCAPLRFRGRDGLLEGG